MCFQVGIIDSHMTVTQQAVAWHDMSMYTSRAVQVFCKCIENQFEQLAQRSCSVWAHVYSVWGTRKILGARADRPYKIKQLPWTIFMHTRSQDHHCTHQIDYNLLDQAATGYPKLLKGYIQSNACVDHGGHAIRIQTGMQFGPLLFVTVVGTQFARYAVHTLLEQAKGKLCAQSVSASHW